ncbi:MAG: hypothetical protein ACYC96_04620 [Fimbriimonadaceae bacterium]
MFLLRFNRGLYAYAFVGTVFCLAGYAIYDDPTFVPILASLGIVGSFAFCMRMCQDDDYGYLAGLENLARHHAGPIINFSLIILMPLFIVLHLVCIILSIIGLAVGREFTVRCWSKLTERHRMVKAHALT